MHGDEKISKWEHCLSSLRSIFCSPKKVIKLLVLLVCIVVVAYQLTECFSKLRSPPITTHSRYELNSSLSFPALTFCRNPGYNPDVLRKYNLSFHPRMLPGWRKFPFDKISLEEVFQNSTYSKSDYFTQYGLGGKSSHVDVLSSIHFEMGQCQTLIPKITTEGTWKRFGYSMVLHHDATTYGSSSGEESPGWHLFIHDVRENFTEINMETSGRVEYMFIKVQEEIEIKLTAQHFIKMANANQCTNDVWYSAIQCEERCSWRQVTENIKCRGPWMPGLDLPMCNNFTSMKALIANYKANDNQNSAFNKSACDCQEPCNSVIYSTSVMNRCLFPKQPRPSSQVWLYYTTKMVTVVEERANYDGPQFIADIGGSLGFLLGLSVLGFIGIVEKIILLFVNACAWRKAGDSSNEVELDEASTQPISDQSNIIFSPTEKINKF